MQSSEEVLESLSSLYYELALSTSSYVFPALKRLSGASHILLGTDYPMRPTEGILASIKQISDAEDFVDDEEFIESPKPKSVSLESVLDRAEISPELLSKLKKGLQDLTNTASGIADISSATLATDVYVKNLNSASESMSLFTEVNSRASHSVEQSLSHLVKTYEHSSSVMAETSKNMAEKFAESTQRINQQLTTSGEKLSTSYKEFSDTFAKDFSTLNENSKTYANELAKVNSNLSSVNSSYELHLQSVKIVTDAAVKANADYVAMQQLVDASLTEAEKYRKHTEQLNRNLEALNQVYGNMLGAMNIKG